MWPPTAHLWERSPMNKVCVSRWSKEGFLSHCQLIRAVDVGGAIRQNHLIVARVRDGRIWTWESKDSYRDVIRTMSNLLAPPGLVKRGSYMDPPPIEVPNAATEPSGLSQRGTATGRDSQQPRQDADTPSVFTWVPPSLMKGRLWYAERLRNLQHAAQVFPDPETVLQEGLDQLWNHRKKLQRGGTCSGVAPNPLVGVPPGTHGGIAQRLPSELSQAARARNTPQCSNG